MPPEVPGGIRQSLKLENLQVGRGFATVTALLDLVADLLALVEGGQASALDGGDVDESVLTALVRLNEAEALGRVEEFHGAIDGHGKTFR